MRHARVTALVSLVALQAVHLTQGQVAARVVEAMEEVVMVMALVAAAHMAATEELPAVDGQDSVPQQGTKATTAALLDACS